MYSLTIKPGAHKVFEKLRNKKQLEIINKKIMEIRENPYHEYKHLKKPLQRFYRAHIDTHFALIFNINHDLQNIDIYFFGHHDDVYKWRPSG
jgi:mRNA-degrading endonuclease RelE of RelBE toxin-antitoxin system